MGEQSARSIPADLTALLEKWSGGDREALEKLVPIVYQELRRMARRQLGHERAWHTLQPTALVNEAYLKLAAVHSIRWQNREHFFAIAGAFMRRILVDYARARKTNKRGGGVGMTTLEGSLLRAEGKGIDIVALEDALLRLAEIDRRQSEIVEMRFFGGLTIEEVAAVLHVSSSTVKSEWTMARAWLYQELGRG